MCALARHWRAVAETAYARWVFKLERIIAAAAAIEAALLIYAAFGAFLTPSGSHQHDYVLMLALLALALPLGWHVASTMMRSGHSDPLLLRVAIPNVAILCACLTGALLPGETSVSFVVALVACASFAMTVGAMRVSRCRLAQEAMTARS